MPYYKIFEKKKEEKITTIFNKLQVKIKPKGEIGSSE